VRRYVAFMIRNVLVVAILISTVACSETRADWPEFRGPFSNGFVAAPAGKPLSDLPLNWSETQNVRWKTPIPDRGWSTPVV